MGDRPWQSINGTVERGHRVASGTAPESPYPGGTIALQTPYFQALGLDLGDYFPGTLNISIHPATVAIRQPEITFRGVAWTDRHPPEDFSFSRCRLIFQGTTYDSWMYYPHPETKKRNFQPPSMLEIIAPPIPAITYGCRVELEYDSAAIVIN